MSLNGSLKVLAVPNVDSTVASSSEAPALVISCYAGERGSWRIAKQASAFPFGIGVPEIHVLSACSPELFAAYYIREYNIKYWVWTTFVSETAVSAFDVPNAHVVVI